MNDFELLEQDGWRLRLQPPRANTPPRLILALHGWSGDENVMSIFTQSCQGLAWIVQPRGPLAVAGGGYGWAQPGAHDFSSLDEFTPVAQSLLRAIQALSTDGRLPTPDTVTLLGFSQGGALAYTLAFLAPHRFRRIACLAGFLPGGTQARLQPGALAGQEYFIAHGSQDEIVAIQHAHHARQVIQQAGAHVTFCESEAGHRVSAGCFKGLTAFLLG